MSTYVMSDIHGCYDDFISMLGTINFSDTDRLIMAGDYIDRGKQSLEMLEWIEKCPPNVLLLRGNHEEEFAAYVDLMLLLDRRAGMDTDFASNMDAAALYQSVKYFMRHKAFSASYFDLYGTMGSLLGQGRVTMHDLCRWSSAIRKMPYYHKTDIGGRQCVVVHAGYYEGMDNTGIRFCLYAREESIMSGGVTHGMVIAGHTPTIVEGRFAYNKGNVFRHYDKAKDCVFYDIDCGCVFRDREPDAKLACNAQLACIRLEDEKIFYV